MDALWTDLPETTISQFRHWVPAVQSRPSACQSTLQSKGAMRRICSRVAAAAILALLIPSVLQAMENSVLPCRLPPSKNSFDGLDTLHCLSCLFLTSWIQDQQTHLACSRLQDLARPDKLIRLSIRSPIDISDIMDQISPCLDPWNTFASKRLQLMWPISDSESLEKWSAIPNKDYVQGHADESNLKSLGEFRKFSNHHSLLNPDFAAPWHVHLAAATFLDVCHGYCWDMVITSHSCSLISSHDAMCLSDSAQTFHELLSAKQRGRKGTHILGQEPCSIEQTTNSRLAFAGDLTGSRRALLYTPTIAPSPLGPASILGQKTRWPELENSNCQVQYHDLSTKIGLRDWGGSHMSTKSRFQSS